MYRVLSVSRNVRLMLDRNAILALAGFSVISPKHPEQAPLLAANEDVDAVVIGHSVEPELRESIIKDVRHLCPNCLVCFVYVAPETQEEPLANVSLDMTNGPEPLVIYLQEQLPRQKAS